VVVVVVKVRSALAELDLVFAVGIFNRLLVDDLFLVYS